MMKRFFKAIVKEAALKVYILGKKQNDEIENQQRLQLIKESGIIHPTAVIYKEAQIQNTQNNPGKIKIGKESRIQGHLMLFKHGGEIIIGDYTFIGPETRIWSAKKITIGNRVLISHNVNVHDNVSHPLDSKERHEDFKHIFSKGFQSEIDLREKEIIIEDDVWIGFNVTIMKGVRIGKGAIIGSNTIVNKDVHSYEVVGGNPMNFIKKTT
ncbi:MAG: acyltransferase [Sphingobacteriales bacterium]|nr:acyltransferase [Sphingobacteriales bacterium]MBI3718045.1 acyltransferase [Sphingobacteriales bacterium]